MSGDPRIETIRQELTGRRKIDESGADALAALASVEHDQAAWKSAYENEVAICAERTSDLAACREALEHYANIDHWSDNHDEWGTASYDGGHSEPWHVARAALSAAAPADPCDEQCHEEGKCSGYCAGDGDPAMPLLPADADQEPT